MDNLCVCGREARAACPSCDRFVLIEKGKCAAHDAPICMGSHMEYKQCKGSGRATRDAVLLSKG